MKEPVNRQEKWRDYEVHVVIDEIISIEKVRAWDAGVENGMLFFSDDCGLVAVFANWVFFTSVLK